MKKILVPTDFSICVEKALHYAIQIAKKTGAEIFLLHACDLLHSAFADKAHLVNEYNNLKTTELNARIDNLKANIAEPGVKITTQLYDSDATESILFFAEQHNVDLIVMGTLGATGLKTVLFGTNTATIIAESTLPVIAIPFNYTWKKPENFLIAISDAEQDVKVFEPVFILGQLFDAKINLAVFSDEATRADELLDHSRLISKSKEQLNKSFPGSNIEILHLSGKDFYGTLQQHIDKEKIDLLVMITHRKTFVQNLFGFSMTRQMAYHTSIPMLSLHSSHDD